ncbi:MAG: class II aldolase/adducin family protein [Candidatus Cloacimonetes bacterium]|jgi:hypothetical protein|nr:class II aldolase/adducin family protein [Candidatus Cloacimonadota bacterium]
MKSALFVVGNFDDNGGRASSYGEGFVKACLKNHQFDIHEIINGGKFDDLKNIDFTLYDTIFWFASVPNDKPKLVDNIKKINPFCMLVTSKRNDGQNGYTLPQLIARALHTKSNLLVEFKRLPGSVTGTVFDPLGNCYARKWITAFGVPHVESFWSSWDLAAILIDRLKVLHTFRRKSSHKIGEAIPVPDSVCKSGFFDLVREYANKFSELIPTHTERFLGNTSFRCASGFPSFRDGKTVFVSKRNIDKRGIDKEGFVAMSDILDEVAYYGDNKPSVDAPIQVLLYRNFPRINFMIHSHTYVSYAVMTSTVIPCGAIDEVCEIQKIVPYRDCNWFFINLRGHGSICAAENIDILQNIRYYARPLPEIQVIKG